jgi:phosphonate utilization transcriptional regulator
MFSKVNPLQLVQSNSLSMLIQPEIERLILSGELAVGQWMNESELAQRFGVSRGTVREAFRMLEQSGLIRQEKNRGVFVREISIKEADDIYDLREALDELVGRTIADTATSKQLKLLHEMLDQMRGAVKANDVVQYHPLNLRFHDLMVEFTGNAKLIATYRRLINELHLFRLRGLAGLDGLRASQDEHRAIVKAIESRNPETAGRIMRSHVIKSRQRMQQSIAAKSAK